MNFYNLLKARAQTLGGKQDTGGSFMDFMIFNEVMNGGQKKQKDNAPEPMRDWIDELEELDAMDDEDK